MKKFIAIMLLVLLSGAAWGQGMKKKGAVESAATPSKSVTTAPEGTAPKVPKGKSWKGSVCTLISCASSKMVNPSKDDAKKSIAHNELLCLCVGKKCYVVINSDGTNASAKLAEHAGSTVTVTGKAVSKNGMNILLADSIQ